MATLDEVREKLETLQNFDTNTLPRQDALGSELNFREAVEPADKLIHLFQQISLDHLSDLPDPQLNIISKQTEVVQKTLDEIAAFSSSQANPGEVRTQLLNQLKAHYQTVFAALLPFIPYFSSQKRDFAALEVEARAAVKAAEAALTEIKSHLSTQKAEAESILAAIRKVAAEQGVSQEALYFKEENEFHETAAGEWKWYTIYTAIGLGAYAALAAYLHKIPWFNLAPTNTYDTVQLGISKVLVFSVIAFILILCARNFMSHRHNAIVNKHRQNALLTFNSLVKAAGSMEGKEIILTHAAGCIFAPQETGYTKSGTDGTRATASVVDAVPKIISKSAPTSG